LRNENQQIAPAAHSLLGWLGVGFSLSRFHIVTIAVGGSLVFGYLLTGGFYPELAALVALDWFLVNLVNRVVDLTEDRANDIAGTEIAARNRRVIYLLAGVLYGASFVLHLFWKPWLALPRAAYHLLGLVYNFRLIPWRGKRVRLKELFGLKNSASMLGFLLTLFAYPAAALTLAPHATPLYFLLLIGFFAPFELSFEAIYDLRDIPGDRAAGVQSYPVVKSVEWTARMILILNVVSAHGVLFGLALGQFGLKEAILGLGPLLQMGLFMQGMARGFSPVDCIRITWAFALMLAGYVTWVSMGMPVELGVNVALPQIIVIGLIVIGALCYRWYAPLYGKRRYLALTALIAVSSFFAEHSAIEYYRFYSYDARWTWFVGHVPLAVVLIWPMVILTSHHVARRLGAIGFKAVGLATMLVMAEAALIEVVCVQAGLWTWEGSGLFGVPLIGIIGWGCFAVGALAVVEFGRGAWVLVMPLAGLVSTHLLLQILWRIGFKPISYTELSTQTSIVAAVLASMTFTGLALWRRTHVRLSVVEIFPRLLAAELMFYLLFAAFPPMSVIVFSLLFVPPYVTLCVYDWAMPGLRSPTRLAPK
jgi:4-hydroxybenzoate polyprenyltransferase